MASCNDLSTLVWEEAPWVEVAHCFNHPLIVLTIALTCHDRCIFGIQLLIRYEMLPNFIGSTKKLQKDLS